MTTRRDHFHDVPVAMYSQLVELFGETEASDPASDTRWVDVGAGSVTLTFFAPRVIVAPEPEPVVRDPESWQAVADAGRKYGVSYRLPRLRVVAWQAVADAGRKYA